MPRRLQHLYQVGCDAFSSPVAPHGRDGFARQGERDVVALSLVLADTIAARADLQPS